MDAYPGSPSLSAEARDKVLHTFRHTLQLAQDGRNEEALLGCDFILKMDTRFLPARRLLEALRGVPVGKVIDLAPFAEFQFVEAAGEALPEEPAAPREPVPASPAAPTLHGTRPSEASAFKKAAGALDDLVFEDLAGADPFSGTGTGTGVFGSGEPKPAPPPARPQPSPLPPSLEPEPPDPLPPPIGPEDDLGLGSHGAAPTPLAPPAPRAPGPTPMPGAPGPGPGRAAAPAAPGVDPRIAQFLKSGDDALARGNVQEAIDLWSRVFLIDLSNQEASKRIDGARDAQAETARKVDALLGDGVHLYEAGDLAGARSKFLDVLALSENDSTASSYLSQIDAAATGKAGPASAFEGAQFPGEPGGAAEGTAGESLEGEATPAFKFDGEEELALPRKKAAAPARRGLDLRLVLFGGVLVVAAAAGGTYWYLRNRKPAAVEEKGPARPQPQRPKAAPKEDLLAKAQALFDQGKVEEAIQTLLSVPENDPRHNEALTKIDQFRSSAAPTPAAAAPNAAGIDELRSAGMAALRSSKYIDAVKALDRVVRARPDDVEAVQALTRAREQVDALRSAVKSYNEGDYESAIKLLWDLRKNDTKNQDVEEYLLNSYVNAAVQAFQAGNIPKATLQLQEAVQIRPGDAEAQRLLRFARRYAKGATDLLAKVFIKHLTIRP